MEPNRDQHATSPNGHTHYENYNGIDYEQVNDTVANVNQKSQEQSNDNYEDPDKTNEPAYN